MTIASEIQKLQTNLTNSYTKCSNKGATMPASENFDNLAGCIDTITTMNGTTLSITPTTSAQSFTPESPYNAFTNVSVSAVTYTIDPNITANNIKAGVNILGVQGNVVELKGETRSELITSTYAATFTPSSGKNGITSITVTPNLYNATFTPTTSTTIVLTPAGYCGINTVTINGVTSSIDANIIPENIKSGIEILGVQGTYSGGGGSLKYGASVDDMLPDLNSSGQPIASASNNHDIVFTGLKSITGEYWGAYRFAYIGARSISFPDLTSISGANTFYYSFANNPNIKKAYFNGFTTLATGNTPFNYAFMNSALEEFHVDNVTSITSGVQTFTYAFMNTKISFFSMPKLETVSTGNTFLQAFRDCTNHPILYFPKLTEFTAGCTSFLSSALYNSNSQDWQVRCPMLKYVGPTSGNGYGHFKQCFSGTTYPTTNLAFSFSLPSAERIYCNASSSSNGNFYSCTALKKIYLPKLTQMLGTTAGIGYNFSGCSKLTEFHFGKANQAAIEATTGYSTLWGRGAGQATVYFDLINTITVNGVNYTRDGTYYDYDNKYWSWTDSGNNTIYTYGTDEYQNQSIGSTVYIKSGDTYTASGTITAAA